MDIVDGYGSRGGPGVKHHASKSRVEGRKVVDCDIWWPVIGNDNDSQKPLKGFLFYGRLRADLDATWRAFLPDWRAESGEHCGNSEGMAGGALGRS
ncbi:MAG: hypothetical protein OXF55_00735 [Caldilineaceae bacterium]|nr:hypothetical protein [Caldilineaceae bacterium]